MLQISPWLPIAVAGRDFKARKGHCDHIVALSKDLHFVSLNIFLLHLVSLNIFLIFFPTIFMSTATFSNSQPARGASRQRQKHGSNVVE